MENPTGRECVDAQEARIVVTVKGAWTAKQYFVSVDDEELVVSNEGGAFLFGWLYNRAGVI